MVILIILMLSLSSIFAKSALVELEWKAEVGDSVIYTYIRYYDDIDQDGDYSKDSFSVINEDGNRVIVTIAAGVTIKITIISLNNVAKIKTTYIMGSGTTNVTTMEETDSITPVYVSKTVTNQTSAEEYAEELDSESVGIEVSVEEDYIITSRVFPPCNKTGVDKTKRDWNSGWLAYRYENLRLTSNGALLKEKEIKSEHYTGPIHPYNYEPYTSGSIEPTTELTIESINTTPGFEVWLILLSVFIFGLALSKKQIIE